jgi:D-galacturonate reductase
MDVLVIGTGEYVTGYVHGAASNSDKSLGVIGLVLFDLRLRGKIERILLCGRDGHRFPGIREHFATQIAARYKGFDVTIETFPADDEYQPSAYTTAIKSLRPQSVVIIVTPDDTHFEIAIAAVQAGMHVLVAKPLVKTLEDHQYLLQAARHHQVLVGVEMHKRFDPIYADARDRACSYGDFSFMSSYMSQPRSQLSTFQAWAGQSSDISYYLNSHHIDWLVWMMQGRGRPIWVSAIAATGVAEAQLGVKTEDTITLTVQWENLPSGHLGTSIHTASWIAPKSDVHSQQRFFLMGQGGELQVDQAHRGYSAATLQEGYASLNPLFMKYTPADGRFVGQDGYGYRSIEKFIDAAICINQKDMMPEEFDTTLPTVAQTLQTTAILQAGRLSLDHENLPVSLYYTESEPLVPNHLLHWYNSGAQLELTSARNFHPTLGA